MFPQRPTFPHGAIALLSIFSLTVLLAACGSAPAAQSGQGTSEASAAGQNATEASAVAADQPAATECKADQKEVVWLVRADEPQGSWATDTVRPAFEQANPDLCLNVFVVPVNEMPIKINGMISAGEKLHVWSPNWSVDGFGTAYARNFIADLTPLIERDNFDTGAFIPEVLDIYKVDGKLFGLPFLTTGSYIYYNQALFDQAGVEYPPFDWDDPSWTWEKFVDTAKRLTKDTDTIDTAVYGTSNGLWPTVDAVAMLWGHKIVSDQAQRDGFTDRIEVVNDRTVTAFSEMRDLVHKHKVAPDQASADALDALGGAFPGGHVAMLMSGGWGHWTFSNLIDDPNGFCWGVAPLPIGAPDAQTRATLFSDPWSMTADMEPEDQDLAWRLIQFLVSEEQARNYLEVTGVPPTQTKLLPEFYKRFEKCIKPADHQKVFEGAFTHGRESSNHLIVGFDELDQVWSNSMDLIWDDPNSDVRSVLTTIEQDSNAALSRTKSESGK